MIHENNSFEQGKTQIFRIFKDFSFSKSLKTAGIHKNYGISAYELFKFLFLLVFQKQNLYQFLNSKRSKEAVSKNSYYRFLNESTFNWRKFILHISCKIIAFLEGLTSEKRVNVFILDDTVISRNSSKKTELLAKVYDHVHHKYVKGFTNLTLGWSDGYSFIPVDFAVVSSAKKSNRYNEIDTRIDKRTNGYRRRKEAIDKKPNLAIKLIRNALNIGITADYVLMDTWFTNEPLIKDILNEGLDVIGMIKRGKALYHYNDELVDIKSIYKTLPRKRGDGIKGEVIVTTKHGIKVKLVFIKNNSKKRDFLVLLSTDTSVSASEIVRIYGNRWKIETFFKSAKHTLKLGSEFESRSFDAVVSHTSIVFARYIVLEYIRRCNSDIKTLGGLFEVCCEDVKDMDFESAISSLFELVLKVVSEGKVCISTIKSQLRYWFESQASFIKALVGDFCWES